LPLHLLSHAPQIDGLNWDVIKATALRFSLHPLALEDAVKFRSHSISKADWFSDQLFVRVLVHSLHPQTSRPSVHNRSGILQQCLEAFGLDRSNRHARDVLAGDTEQAGTFGFGIDPDDDDDADSEDDGQDTVDQDARLLAGGKRWSWADDENEKGVEDVKLEEQLAAKAVVKSLTSSFRVAIDKQQMSSFLLPTDSKHGGTLISIFTVSAAFSIPFASLILFFYTLETTVSDSFVISLCRPSQTSQDSGAGLTDSIIQRIRTPGTLLRTTEDPSMLLQALLDVVVDDVLEVVEEFRRELDVLEGRALVNPDIKAVRHLHVLSGQLLMCVQETTHFNTFPLLSLYRARSADTVFLTLLFLTPPAGSNERSPHSKRCSSAYVSTTPNEPKSPVISPQTPARRTASTKDTTP
jgi:Mg2+ and Co2+ transporter CorA